MIPSDQQDLDSFIAKASLPLAFKYRFNMFKKHIQEYGLSNEELLFLYNNHEVVRAIMEWDGHYKLMQALDFETRKL